VFSDALPPALLVHATPGRRTAICGVWITCGSAHEPSSLAGATHLVEHLTLRRCGGHDRRSLAELVDRLGGDVDAWTSFELMGVSVTTTVDALADGIALLVDAVLEPSFDPADVELERRVAQAELELIADDPAERVEEGILRAAWGDHPLARPVIGSAETIGGLTPDRLRSHHQSLIQPGRVLAAVVGDVEPSWAAEQLRRLPLGSFPSPPELPELAWHDLVALYQGCSAVIADDAGALWGGAARLALAAGKSVVGFRSASLDQLLGKAAYLVEAGDLRSLGAAIISVVVDETMWEKLEEASKKESAKWDQASFSNKLESEYRKLI